MEVQCLSLAVISQAGLVPRKGFFQHPANMWISILLSYLEFVPWTPCPHLSRIQGMKFRLFLFHWARESARKIDSLPVHSVFPWTPVILGSTFNDLESASL